MPKISDPQTFGWLMNDKNQRYDGNVISINFNSFFKSTILKYELNMLFNLNLLSFCKIAFIENGVIKFQQTKVSVNIASIFFTLIECRSK